MQNELLEELAQKIAQSKNKQHILDEIEWMLEGNYSKCHLIAILMTNRIYKPEYYKLAEELQNRELLLKLYNLIRKFIHNKS